MEVTNIYDYLDSKRIYQALDKLREERGLTVYALSKAAGVSHATVYKWRDEKSSPSLYLLESLCSVLDVSLINLLISNEELIHLTEKDKTFFDLLKTLTKNQRTAILALMRSMQEENLKK